MAISDNVISEFPNLLGNLIELILEIISYFFNSWIMVLFFFTVMTTLVLMYKLFQDRFVRDL